MTEEAVKVGRKSSIEVLPKAQEAREKAQLCKY